MSPQEICYDKKSNTCKTGKNHIMHLKVDGYERSRDYCIAEIERKIPYKTQPIQGDGAPITVYTKGSDKYLRTEADGTEENNLGGLPLF